MGHCRGDTQLPTNPCFDEPLIRTQAAAAGRHGRLVNTSHRPENSISESCCGWTPLAVCCWTSLTSPLLWLDATVAGWSVPIASHAKLSIREAGGKAATEHRCHTATHWNQAAAWPTLQSHILFQSHCIIK